MALDPGYEGKPGTFTIPFEKPNNGELATARQLGRRRAETPRQRVRRHRS
jgi:hypothetical protein